MTEVFLKVVYCLEAPIFFWIALEHAYIQRGTGVYTESKTVSDTALYSKSMYYKATRFPNLCEP